MNVLGSSSRKTLVTVDLKRQVSSGQSVHLQPCLRGKIWLLSSYDEAVAATLRAARRPGAFADLDQTAQRSLRASPCSRMECRHRNGELRHM